MAAASALGIPSVTGVCDRAVAVAVAVAVAGAIAVAVATGKKEVTRRLSRLWRS